MDLPSNVCLEILLTKMIVFANVGKFRLCHLQSSEVTKNNHCCKAKVTVEYKAEEGHTLEWFSSSISAGKYYIKPQVRAFISRLCNMLPKIHFSLYCFIVKMILSIPPSIYILQNGSWFYLCRTTCATV